MVNHYTLPHETLQPSANNFIKSSEKQKTYTHTQKVKSEDPLFPLPHPTSQCPSKKRHNGVQ